MDTVTHTPTQATQPADIPKTVGPWARASDVRRRARSVLNTHVGGRSHRMTLTLAVVFVLTASVALYAAVACVATAGYLAFGEALWVDAASNILLAILGLGLILPLIASTYRLACLMTAPDGEVTDGLAVSVPAATLSGLFYPFTSLRAYGRTMAVAMEGLAFALLSVGVPILCFRLASLSLDMLSEVPRLLLVLAKAGAFLLCLALGLLVFLLSGRRAGFGYFVFVHESLPLREVNRYYRGFARALLPALCLRVSLAGWVALSAVGIFVPFVFHTVPYGLCCSAAYGRSLKRL